MLDIGAEILRGADDFFSDPRILKKHKAKSERSTKALPKVLVVDDEQTIAKTLAEILRQSGFQAIAVYDGPAALEIAAKFKPDYLITDVLMPSMNGVELAMAISKMFPAAKILLFSGQAGISDILERGREEGYVFDMVAKPIHPEKLIEQLKKKP